MFAIYGIGGPIFQGTLESLSRLPPVVRRGPATPARRIGDQPEPGTSGTAAASGAGAHAIEEYQAMMPQNLERGPLYHAQQIMQPEVITVNADDDVAHAWRVLVAHRIRQAPVLDANLRLVGIVSERNVLSALKVDISELHGVLASRVRDVMMTPVVAASPITDIRRIAQVMLDRDVEGVPIINDNGTLVGFISRSDILHAVVTDPPLSIWR